MLNSNMCILMHGRRIAVGTDDTVHIIDCETGKSLYSKTLGKHNIIPVSILSL